MRRHTTFRSRKDGTKYPISRKTGKQRFARTLIGSSDRKEELRRKIFDDFSKMMGPEGAKKMMGLLDVIVEEEHLIDHRSENKHLRTSLAEGRIPPSMMRGPIPMDQFIAHSTNPERARQQLYDDANAKDLELVEVQKHLAELEGPKEIDVMMDHHQKMIDAIKLSREQTVTRLNLVESVLYINDENEFFAELATLVPDKKAPPVEIGEAVLAGPGSPKYLEVKSAYEEMIGYKVSDSEFKTGAMESLKQILREETPRIRDQVALSNVEIEVREARIRELQTMKEDKLRMQADQELIEREPPLEPPEERPEEENE